MSTTIELLESIGQDALLRHATSAQLAQVLSAAGASEAFKQSVLTHNSRLLAEELGADEKRLTNIPTNAHAPWSDDEDEDAWGEDENGDEQREDEAAEPDK